MAGGEGAKERRRLKRLAAQKAKNKSDSSPPKTQDMKPNSNNARDDRNNKRASNHSGTKWNKNKPKSNAKKEKRPKFKKPKHLKRKLEQACNESGEAKEVIKKEIDQFEAKKIFYSKKSRSNKRKKSADFDSSGSGNDDRTVSRLNRMNSNTSPFPISEKVEAKEAAVVEDDDIEITDDKETTGAKVVVSKDLPSITNTETDEDSTHGSSDDESSDDDAGEPASSGRIETENTATSDETSNEDGDAAGDSSSNSDKDSDEDSDDDTDDDEPVQQRQRGRRRRGRKDTAKKIEEMEAVEKSYEVAEKSNSSTEGTGKSKSELKDNSIKDGKKRYCIGRKPVTDFGIGQSHPAKVVYVKPFGVFFDIGCHSDAFCHVSRLSDDYIESPESKFKEGDEVPKVRIVEIDRKQKRITVSLQSEARIEDERESIEARKSRKEKRKNKSKNKPSTHSSGGNDRSENYNIQGTSVSNEFAAKKVLPKPSKRNVDPSMMTPAELKRARKLARRAERRAQSEQEEQSQENS